MNAHDVNGVLVIGEDELSILINVPEHREVAAVWAALQATSTQATDR